MAASAFPVTPPSAAPSGDSASAIRSSSRRSLRVVQELPNLIGLASLTTNGRPLMAPKLNRRRAVFVLSKVDEILAWEKATDLQRDTRFVELGRYLCEIRAGQYWG